MDIEATLQAMTNGVLLRERAALQGQIEIASQAIERNDSHVKYHKRRTDELGAILVQVGAEVERRHLAGKWTEPQVPLAAALVALVGECIAAEYLCEPDKIEITRSKGWDGRDETVAFKGSVSGRTDSPPHSGLSSMAFKCPFTIEVSSGVVTAIVGA